MKKKSHPPPPPFPPSSSPSTSSSSSDASDSESDDRELQPQVTRTAPASTGHVKPKLSPPPSESKSEECEDESETPSSEDIMTATPAPSTTNKEKNPSDKSKDPSSTTSGAGKKFFQRLWTNEDELALIKGLVKFNKKHGKDPSAASEYSAFLDQMKGRLHIEFSKDQFMTKIRNIKRKYIKYLDNLMNGSITSVKEHDQNCFNLLRKIWGDELKTRSSKKDIKNVAVENETMDSGESGPKKKKKKMEAGTQVIENVNGADVEDVDGACSNILDDVFNRHNIEMSIKYKMKNVLLSLEPKELKDWEKRYVSKYNLKWDVLRDLNDLENEFIQTLWKNLKS